MDKVICKMFYDFTEKKTHNKNIKNVADKKQRLRYDNTTVNIFMGRSEMLKVITKNYKVRYVYQIIS